MNVDLEKLIMRPINIILAERTNIEAFFYDSQCIHIVLSNINIWSFRLRKTKNFIVDKGKKAVPLGSKNYPKLQRRYLVLDNFNLAMAWRT
jgi:hypothetical protein